MKRIWLGIMVSSVALVAGCQSEQVEILDPEVNLSEEVSGEALSFTLPLSADARKVVGFGNNSYYYTYEGYQMADELLETREFKTYDVSLPIDWKSFDELEDRDMPYRLNSFKFMTCLIQAYEETGEAKYREEAMAYILDWIEAHPGKFEGSEWAWHDDATARRTFIFASAYAVFGDTLPEAERQQLADSIRMQMEVLATEEFYKPLHNHGMFQDQAIALGALLLEEGDRQKEFMALAKERSLEYFRYSITEDGVHKEHSPSYQYEIVDAVHWYGLVYEALDPEFSKEMKEWESKMEKYLIHVSLPNGLKPSIGDSAHRRYRYDGWENDATYLYAVTGGKEGVAPSETMAVFEEGGYGIMRSSWEDTPQEATWMMLLASTHSGTHKHNDDLSFLLYHKGDLFTEAGNRNYNYLEPETRYVYESYGHNVLFVNDEPFKMGIKLPSINDRAKLTQITDFVMEGDVQSVTGSQQRFSGIEQSRTLSYDRVNEVVTVKDLLTTTKKANGRLTYHLAEGVEPKATENGWELYRNDVLIATVAVSGSEEVSLSSIYGQNGDSPYKGLIFGGNTEAIEAHVLIVDFPIIKGLNEVEFKIELH